MSALLSSSRDARAQLPQLPSFPTNSGAFGLWKMQAYAVLLAHDLLDVVETDRASGAVKEEHMKRSAARAEQAAGAASSAAAEESSASPPMSKDKDIVRSRRAYGALMLALGHTQLQLCQRVALGDAHGVWQVLLDTYDRKSVATRVQLIERLFSMEQGRSESVSVYVSRVTEVEQRLREQGEEVSGAILLYVLLRGVTRAYPTLVTLLKMKDALTFDEAVEAIKNEEERTKMDVRRENQSGGGTDHTVYMARTEKSKTGGDERRCHECGDKGHLRNRCPQTVCHRCERTGHVAANCRAVWKGDKKGARKEGEDGFMAVTELTYRDDDEEEDWCA
jgi:hypothetical protein